MSLTEDGRKDWEKKLRQEGLQNVRLKLFQGDYKNEGGFIQSFIQAWIKKIEEKQLLEKFKKTSGLNFDILETDQARTIFPSYTGENPDFIINLNGCQIGVDLFMLCLTKSPQAIGYGGKEYINQMQKKNEHPNKFKSLEELEENIKQRKEQPEIYQLTRHDDPFDIVRERLSQKVNKVKNYVTPKNWLLGFVDQFFNMCLVENIAKDGEEQYYQSLIKDIVCREVRIERVILFETGTGPEDKIFEYINV